MKNQAIALNSHAIGGQSNHDGTPPQIMINVIKGTSYVLENKELTIWNKIRKHNKISSSILQLTDYCCLTSQCFDYIHDENNFNKHCIMEVE